MAIKVGINGFGRIGRNIMRAAMGNAAIDFVAVNDITDTKTLAHLLKYDSILGNLDAAIEAGDGWISVDGDKFQVLSQKDPAQLPWKDLGVDVVFEGTGKFTKRDDAAKHIAAGAKRVIITAPATGPDASFVMGVNNETVRPREARHHLERVLHDELPRAGREGAERLVRHQEGLDDHHPLLHQRSERPRLPAQGPAARPRGGAVDDSDDDRRGQGRGRGAAGAEGQARRLLDARPDAERLRGRPGRHRREEDDRRGGERGVPRGGGRPAEGHPRGRGRAARVDRLPRQLQLVDRRLGVHEGDGLGLRQGPLVVRQRVGLLEALRRSVLYMATKGI